MKIGDYVRTKKGIGQIISFDYCGYNECCFIELSNRRIGIKQYNIIKSSPNIIDLIEVGDFIGKIMVEQVKEFDDGTRVIVMADGFDEYDENEYFLEAGIVTKEQFEEMEYKING